MAAGAIVLFLKPLLQKGKAYDGRTDWEQLSSIGLKIVPVSADGNCFFRSVTPGDRVKLGRGEEGHFDQ